MTGKIVVYDDAKTIQRLLKISLTRRGYEVSTYDCPIDSLPAGVKPAAAELARALEGIDCVITDINMPGMLGTTFLGLSREGGYRKPAIIMCGSLEKDRPLVLAVQAKWPQYVHEVRAKPFESLNEIGTLVDRLVAESKFR